MDRIIDRTVRFMIDNDAISADDVDALEIHKYGLYCIITDVIDFSVLIALSLTFGVFKHTVFYYVAFIGMRRLAGGYHAKTFLRCFCISLVTWIISMWLILKLTNINLLSIIIAAISVVPVCLWAPIEHVNNPMSNNKKIKKRKFAVRYAFVIFIVVAACSFAACYGIPTWISASLAWGLAFFSGSLIAARIQEKYKDSKHYKRQAYDK